MIRVDPFQPDDLRAMAIQAAQAGDTRDWMALGRANAIGGCALTARDGDGRILMCGGAIEVHTGYATLWAVLAADAGPAMVALTRRTRTFVALLRQPRVDAMVRVGFVAGQRWARMLGLAEEATLAGVFEDGGDARIYRLRRDG